MTQERLQLLDELLVEFGAMLLDKPAVGRNAELAREDHFRRITFVRKLMYAALD